MCSDVANRLISVVLWPIAVMMFGVTTIGAVPGDLDPIFGVGGIIIDGSVFDVSAMAVQSDGKIVAVGVGPDSFVAGFAVARYNSNGSRDSSFGIGGSVITPIGGRYDRAASIAIDAEGKIVVAGLSFDIAGESSRFAVVRYWPTGTLDTSFNDTGIAITPVNNTGAAHSVAIQADGKIVAAGASDDGEYQSFTLVRYNNSGKVDISFGKAGKVFTTIGWASAINSVTTQPDGKIVAGGYSYPGGYNDFAVARYNSDGSLDATFAGAGFVTTPVGNAFSSAQSVAIQSNGRIIAVGNKRNELNETDFAFVRYTANGLLDTSFGVTGKVIIPVGNFNDGASSVVIQPDGKIVAAGSCQWIGYSYADDFALVRLYPNGSLDTTLNGTGKVTTPFPGYGWDIASSVAIQPDGGIVVAGTSGDPDYPAPLAMVRYQGGSNANIRTRFDFDGDGRADTSVFRPSDGYWYLNNSQTGFSAKQFGLSTDQITPGDFDGDGKMDISVYRDGNWYWLKSSDGSFNAAQFGSGGDLPVPGDYNGDGRAELAVYRGGTWWTYDMTNNQTQAIQFGLATDKPVTADYDGDGRIDQAVYRAGIWYLNRSSFGFTAFPFGISTDRPVVADYDGDGRADPAVYRDGTWYLLGSSQGFAALQFGIATDIPAPADYDGDGSTDAAVFRSGTWYQLQSTSGYAAHQFGTAGDRPIESAYNPR